LIKHESVLKALKPHLRVGAVELNLR
jgi:hypothetical protein